MKLLFDANLSAKLVEQVADLLPDSVHVRHTGTATGKQVCPWHPVANA